MVVRWLEERFDDEDRRVKGHRSDSMSFSLGHTAWKSSMCDFEHTEAEINTHAHAHIRAGRLAL